MRDIHFTTRTRNTQPAGIEPARLRLRRPAILQWKTAARGASADRTHLSPGCNRRPSQKDHSKNLDKESSAGGHQKDNRQTSVQESERRESNSLSWVGSPEPNQSATLARESHHRNLRPVLARTGGAHRYLCFGGEVDRARIELASTACKAISLPLTYQPETKPDRRAGHRPRDLRLVKTMLFQTELRDGHGTGGNRTHPHNPYQGSPFNQSCLSRHVPGPIRTDDLQLRKPLHYPTVLREHEGDRRESNPRYWSHNPALYH
jgi:hypothetical protein